MLLVLLALGAALNRCDVSAGERSTLAARIAEPPGGALYLGVYPGGHDGMGSDIAPDDVAGFENAAGKAAAWIYFCHNWYEGRAFPWATASWIRARGSVPYIRLMLLSDPEIPRPDPVFTLEKIRTGAFDRDLRAWMSAARRFATPVLAEYGVEANGWWFPWNGLYNREGGSYDDSVLRFREAYRRIVRIAREERAWNVRWVFHIDPWDDPVQPWNRFENYYPGDEWIDWVGVSVYGRQVPKDKVALTFRQQMDWVYGRLRILTRKPVLVCEFGNIRDPIQAGWARAALADLVARRWPAVIGFSWWNAAFFNDDVTGGESDMRVQDSPELAAVFRELVSHDGRVLSRARTERPPAAW